MSEDIADHMAMSGDYERVGVNVAVKTVTGVPTDPITRPDVTGLRKDGKVDIVEVPSPTDKFRELDSKAERHFQIFSVEFWRILLGGMGK